MSQRPAPRIQAAASHAHCNSRSDPRQVIALPISHKSWERSGHTDGTPRPPKEDVNAPDLYLPLMAFATYVLLFGYTLGARGTFTPEVDPLHPARD